MQTMLTTEDKKDYNSSWKKSSFIIALLLSFNSCQKDAPKPVTLPAVTTTAISAIAAVSGSSGGNISSDGGGSITARGIVWGTSTSPTISLATKTTDGTGTGSFASNLTGLSPGTKYYVRAYATNSSGTAYGEELNFTTLASLPTIATTTISSITSSTALGGGNISSDGGGLITARGIVWSTSTSPTISLTTKTTDGTGTGSFTSNITGLTAGTTYYLKSYATNSVGTAYGNEIEFTTIPISINDIDGNVYHTIIIGNQVWLAENLLVTRYNDGTPITNITDNTEWENTTSAAYCYYGNDDTNKIPNGAIYNWYVINPATNLGKNVCPQGWHVPTSSEWFTLQNFVDPMVTLVNAFGIQGIDFGKKMKSKTGWIVDGNGTDEFKFNGLPTGYRNTDGSFQSAGDLTYHWSVTPCNNCSPNPGGGFASALAFNISGAWNNPHQPTNGFCIRCLKD